MLLISSVNSVASHHAHTSITQLLHNVTNAKHEQSGSSLGCARRFTTGSLATLLEDSDKEPTSTGCILLAWDAAEDCRDCVDQPTVDDTVSASCIIGITSTTTQSHNKSYQQKSMASQSKNASIWHARTHVRTHACTYVCKDRRTGLMPHWPIGWTMEAQQQRQLLQNYKQLQRWHG